MIVKRKDGYHVMAESGRHMGGPYSSRGQAVKRLQQIEYFKKQGAWQTSPTPRPLHGSKASIKRQSMFGEGNMTTKMAAFKDEINKLAGFGTWASGMLTGLRRATAGAAASPMAALKGIAETGGIARAAKTVGLGVMKHPIATGAATGGVMGAISGARSDSEGHGGGLGGALKGALIGTAAGGAIGAGAGYGAGMLRGMGSSPEAIDRLYRMRMAKVGGYTEHGRMREEAKAKAFNALSTDYAAAGKEHPGMDYLKSTYPESFIYKLQARKNAYKAQQEGLGNIKTHVPFVGMGPKGKAALQKLVGE